MIENKPSIYNQPSVYKQGGGAGRVENEDGSLQGVALSNTLDTNVFEIGGLSLYNCDKIELVFRHYSGRGILSFMNPNVSDPMLAINDHYYFDMHTLDIGTWGGSPTVNLTTSFNIYKLTLQYDPTSPSSNYSDVTQSVNGVDEAAKWGPSTAWGYYQFACNSIRFFKGRNAYDSGILDIFGCKIWDYGTNELKYNFIPSDKENVAGFYEDVNGVFYQEPYNNGTIFLTK